MGKGERGLEQPSRTHSRIISYRYNLFRWYPYKLSKRQLCIWSPSSSMVADGVLAHFLHGCRRRHCSLILGDASVYCVLIFCRLSVIYSMTWIISRLPVLLAIVQKVRISKEFETNRMAKENITGRFVTTQLWQLWQSDKKKLTLSFLLSIDLLP